MSADLNWYSDRSRTQDCWRCKRLRYLKYHAITGYGIDSKGVSLPLTTGIHVHRPLALILEECMDGKIPSTARVREIIGYALADYQAEVTERGFLDAESSDAARTIAEQSCLIEGLVWGYVRAILPTVLKEFEIIAVEKEYLLKLADGIILQSRPDFVARRRRDGVLGIHDFKTARYISDDEVASYNHNVQMSLGTAAVEATEGERVSHFYIHALIKGIRRPFKKGGIDTPYEAQHSSLVYAKLTPAMPPHKREPSWALTGYWADKQALWSLPEGFWPTKPAEISVSEHWVTHVLPIAELQEQFKLMGPYDRPDHLIAASLREIEYEERRWIDDLFELHAEPRPFGDPSFQSDLSRLFPRSWDCDSYYGGPCPMKHICFAQVGWEEPLLTGRYQVRIPHHEQELQQAAARGVPLPLRGK